MLPALFYYVLQVARCYVGESGHLDKGRVFGFG